MQKSDAYMFVANVLSLAASDAFAALSTTPLFCLRILDSVAGFGDLHERFDLWHSCIRVAEKAIVSYRLNEPSLKSVMAELSQAITDLRDGYAQIKCVVDSPSTTVPSLFDKIESAYERIHRGLDEFSNRTAVTPSFVSGLNSMRQTGHV